MLSALLDLLFILTGISLVFASVLQEHGIVETRLPVELDVEHCNWLEPSKTEFYQGVVQDARDATVAFDSKGLR